MGRVKGTALLGATVWLIVAVSTAGAATWSDALFVEKSHDFGPVPRGGKFRHDFRLANRLKEAVTILNVRASCGCTTGRSTAAQVSPGQSALIETEIDTRNFVGLKETVVYVTLVAAGGTEAEVRLTLSVNILSDIVLNPGTIDFGTVVRGQAMERVLTIDRVGASSWKVRRMVSASRLLQGQLVETTRDDSAVQYKLTVGLRPDAPAGVIREEIRLLTNDPETPSIPIPVTATIRSDLTATPSLLAMGRVVSAGAAESRFLIRASKPFAIVAVEGDGDGFKVAAHDTNKTTSHFVTVTYRAKEGRSRGDLRHDFRVVTDLPGELPLNLTATCHVEP